MGEIFLRKYLTTFNYETREIIFYKNQIEEANKINNISYNEFNLLKIIKIYIEIFIILITIYSIFLLYRKYKKYKSINSNELEDKNLIDTSKEINDNI